MAVLEIKRYPEEVLKKKALPVENINGDLQHLVNDMIETMYAASGVGLAAPQVGISKRLIVIDVGTRGEEHPLVVLINPEIVDTDGLIDSEEGCLSLPGQSMTLKRAGRIVVKGLNMESKSVEVEATGLLSRALQHEIDHLDGILIVDRLNPIKMGFFKERCLKAFK